ncbi:1-aminocyclopropane-1-carboxylate deaminase/D-cysteine desulfhydrase [Teredinibacter turnerae]|uniref:1-aminocyclopropane-1-carboxylate deaminase/D-cysteine desulfhydrase n=1 Tax=Teredinibacter turnerae TaxID=2426 RepID=UPI001E541694|nr:pyridoxal-phosphate dependent enzyme [Teredinibacter turnerae]
MAIKPSSTLAANLKSVLSGDSLLPLLRTTPIERISTPASSDAMLEVSMVRLDALCPYLGGNKIFKLWGYLRHYLASGETRPIASFGGAYSNHLHALAYACHFLGVPMVAYVRGERCNDLSPTLADLEALNVVLKFVSRAQYRAKQDAEWRRLQGDYFWVEEGGGGDLGTLGAAELGRFLRSELTYEPGATLSVMLACGTATTLAGVLKGMSGGARENISVVGVSALKNAEQGLVRQVESLLGNVEPLINWRIEGGFHCGGFGRLPDYLADFVQNFETENRIKLDPIYTAKLLFALDTLAAQDVWPGGTKITVVHSGGMQGRRGFQL